MDNCEFKKMLGYFVHISNILNANHEKRAQADGFDVKALDLVHNFKSNNKVSLLQYVMGKMREQDPQFPETLKQKTESKFKTSLRMSETNTKIYADFKKQATEILEELGEFERQIPDFEQDVNFVQVFKEKLEAKSAEAKQIEALIKALQEEHIRCCDMWRIREHDDMYKEPSKFIRLFYDFYMNANKACEALPKLSTPKKTGSVLGKRNH
jgi:hypothetical protein